MGGLGRILRRTRESPSKVDQAAEAAPETDHGRASANTSKLGTLLRETREQKRLGLEQVESATRIRERFLRALEEGNYDQLPTPGHVQGFLRNYALYLGLDLEEVEALYAADRAGHRRFEPKIFHPKDIELVSRKPLIKASLIFWSVITLVVVVVGGGLFWRYAWPLVRPTPTSTPTATAARDAVVVRPSATPTLTRVAPTETPVSPTATATEAPTEPSPEPTSTATSTAPLTIDTPTPTPTNTPSPTPTKASGVVLQVRVIERTWLQVTMDGQQLPGELLQDGEERTWEAQFSIYLICGNAGGIEAVLNGEELGVLGERGQVVEKLWTTEGEVTPTPAAEGGAATLTVTPSAVDRETPTPTPTP
jgi:cytoskeleton protein RodZ